MYQCISLYIHTHAQEKEDIAPERQRWLFGGQLLPDSQTLAGAKVPPDSVVQVMVRPEDTPP